MKEYCLQWIIKSWKEQILLQNVGNIKFSIQFDWNTFQDTQRRLKYENIIKYCFVCIWTYIWSFMCEQIFNFEQIFKSFNDCLFILKVVETLKIVYFVPKTLLNLNILRWKQIEIAQSNMSLFNRKTLLKSCGWLFIHCRTLLNIDHTLLNIWPIVERLHTYIVEYMINC